MGIDILERVRFRKKSFTTDQILKWTWFVWKEILMNDLLAENLFSTLLSLKNANFFSNAISQKPWYREKKEKKTVFEWRLSKKTDFETGF